MADNLQKFKFTIDTVQRYRQAARDVDHLFAKVAPKNRAGCMGKRKQAKESLIAIAEYVYANIGLIPQQATEKIGHDARAVQRVRDAKEAAKVVFFTIAEGKRAEHQRKYAGMIDLLNRFRDHLDYVMRLEASRESN